MQEFWQKWCKNMQKDDKYGHKEQEGVTGGRAPTWQRLLAPNGRSLAPQVALPCPLAPYVHGLHHFGLFLPYFLHTNNSTSTSGTR